MDILSDMFPTKLTDACSHSEKAPIFVSSIIHYLTGAANSSNSFNKLPRPAIKPATPRWESRHFAHAACITMYYSQCVVPTAYRSANKVRTITLLLHYYSSSCTPCTVLHKLMHASSGQWLQDGMWCIYYFRTFKVCWGGLIDWSGNFYCSKYISYSISNEKCLQESV